jgi:transcription-repair coupling factor (superfamily II helicase)
VESLEQIARKLTARETSVCLTGLKGAARSAAFAELVRAHGERPILVIGASSKACDALGEDLRAALGGAEAEPGRRVRSFPRHDTLPYERFSPQPFVVAQRMDVLYRWLSDPGRAGTARSESPPIAIGPWSALALRVPSREQVRAATVHLEVGHSIDRDTLVELLIHAGYARMAIVEEKGEIAVRGGILDIFPPHCDLPIRVELLGDEIESIREFDPASQRSQEKLDRAAAPPPRELLFSRERVIAQGDDIRLLAIDQGGDEASANELIDALLRGHLPPGIEALAPLLLSGQESAFDYLPDDTLVVIDDPATAFERVEQYVSDAEHNFEVAHDAGRICSAPDEVLLTPEEIRRLTYEHQPVSLARLYIEDPASDEVRIEVESQDQGELRRALARTRTHERALTPLADQLGLWMVDRWRVTIACHSLSMAERLKSLLGGYGIEPKLVNDPRPLWRWATPGRIELRVARLSSGAILPAERRAIVTEEEIFGQRERSRRQRDWKEGAAVEGLAQLAPGDFLVHSEHGIGTYRGLVEVNVRHLRNEMLRIDYAGGDRLFIPVHSLDRVQRYGGADGAQPRLDRLGGSSWDKAKKKVKKSLRNMAQELLSVHAARELTSGYAYSPRDTYFEEFEAAFPYEETPDQHSAIEDVLADMQIARPMDRLVCGDVGYGKTEVAARAAFRAALDGKQVAFLVPTTVLCQQHHETLRERFAGYPIKLASLSRFDPPKRSREVLEGMADGTIDVVVGTHRLLQKKVRFRDLGLLIVDEEHRFGVAHKERIKQLKKTVDVLTLTATPIPRTLQLAFTGVRELSVINTPPADRLAVRTQVSRFSESLIREAILREVRRGGQVFFVHNRVASIGAVYELLERLVPEVKVLVGHGQMKERELEDVMLAFQHGEADVLLCTTIIESGIDIPRANTILIDRADALGLAQLYQLRGRVGRSDHRAYAYLMIPIMQEALPGDAQRRLEAIQDLSELGSGFRLANMDLEIRGAGNLLGGEQSGNMLAVGYETYMELLEETVEELRGTIREAEIDPEIRLPVQARLPEEYVPDVSQRLVLYKRLSSAREDEDVDRIRDEILDRYGALPREGESLVEVIRLKSLARRLGVVAIDLNRGEIVLSVGAGARIDPQRLVNLLTGGGSELRVSPDHKIFAPAPTSGGEPAVLDAARSLLTRLAGSA